MQEQLAFVLGAGGSRGALQVGALRALVEAGYRPDVITGASVGAVNAAYLALYGADLSAIAGLEAAWHDMIAPQLVPSGFLWPGIRLLINRPTSTYSQRLEKFFIAHGLSRETRFRDVTAARLGIMAADLNSGSPVLNGLDPDQSILEALLAAISLPPWLAPMKKDGLFLIDGGTVSFLPIEAALRLGATEIIALDLYDGEAQLIELPGAGQLIGKLINMVGRRHIELEMALAESRGVAVRRITLTARQAINLWDYRFTPQLIEIGYTAARQQIAGRR
jgi:NTE family protein